MQHATRTFFPNYFNGSEIVVAGRLADGPLDQLRVEVTASNGKKFVVLKAHVPVERQTAGRGGPGGAGPGPEDAGEAGPNPLQRLWSYLTVKELLSSWLRSGGGREKERLRQKAQALAVNSHFLTPFTAMKLKQARGPEQGAGAFGVSAATGPGTAVQSLPPGTGRGPGRPCRLLSGPRSPRGGLLRFVVNLQQQRACTQPLACRVCGTVGWFRCTLWVSVGHLEKVAAVSETWPAGRHQPSVPCA